VDGVLDTANFNYTPSGSTTLNTTCLGSQVRAAISTNTIFQGTMYEVMIWERALTQTEVQSVMVSGVPTPISKLPYIVNQPVGGIRRQADQILLSARAAGNRPFSYKWFKDAAQISSATNSSITLSNVTIFESGKYQLVVSNNSGSTTSSVAIVTVEPASPFATNIFSRHPDFSSSNGMIFHNSAMLTNTADGNVLRLVPAESMRSGTVFSSNLVNASEFSTFFTFRYTSPGRLGGGADGIVFVVTRTLQAHGLVGGGMGYQNLTNTVGVEFDIYNNPDPINNDQNGSHIAIDVGGKFDSSPDEINSAQVSPGMKNGDRMFAWIDYDGSVLEGRVNRTGIRPSLPNVRRKLSITDEVGGSLAMVGFTAGTGDGYANHDVLSWQFNTTYDPILALRPSVTLQILTLNRTNVPALTITGSVGSTYGIQRAVAFGSTNNWTTLTNFVLSNNPTVWMEPSPSTNATQFYRVVPQ
jgi:hypothetical protein